jgi:hypothetical protein
MKAANTEIEYLEERWRWLPGEEQVAGIVLEDLLDAQERGGNAEINFASSQVGYNLALAKWNRATGILLKCLPDPSSAGQGAPTKDGREDIPLPPSEVIPPPPQPPAVTNFPNNAAGKTSANTTPAQPQANLNRAAGIVGKSQIGPLPAKQGTAPKGAVETRPLPQSDVLAPLPPPIANDPAVAADAPSTNNIPLQSQANLNRASGIAKKSQSKPLPAKQGALPKDGEELRQLPSSEVLAPLPPPITNVPATAAGTTPTKTIVAR